jgi:hypothetical protein
MNPRFRDRIWSLVCHTVIIKLLGSGDVLSGLSDYFLSVLGLARSSIISTTPSVNLRV